jgi:hypothetical protein
VPASVFTTRMGGAECPPESLFFRRTNRGGLAKNSARKSKLLGIARWLQRRMLWYSGNGDAIFNIDNCNHLDGNDIDADDGLSTGSGDSYTSATIEMEGNQDKDDSLVDSDDEMSIISAEEDDHNSDV